MCSVWSLVVCVHHVEHGSLYLFSPCMTHGFFNTTFIKEAMGFQYLFLQKNITINLRRKQKYWYQGYQTTTSLQDNNAQVIKNAWPIILTKFRTHGDLLIVYLLVLIPGIPQESVLVQHNAWVSLPHGCIGWGSKIFCSLKTFCMLLHSQS